MPIFSRKSLVLLIVISMQTLNLFPDLLALTGIAVFVFDWLVPLN